MGSRGENCERGEAGRIHGGTLAPTWTPPRQILADSGTPQVNQCDAELDVRFTHAVYGDVEHVALCSI